jgi:hypothetical protein
MTYTITEVAVCPIMIDEDDEFNASEVNDEEIDCWEVHSFASDGQGGGMIVDEDDFPDFDAAIAHAEKLAQKYGVRIDHRY